MASENLDATDGLNDEGSSVDGPINSGGDSTEMHTDSSKQEAQVKCSTNSTETPNAAASTDAQVNSTPNITEESGTDADITAQDSTTPPASSSPDSTSNGESKQPPGDGPPPETVTFTVIFNKKKQEVSFPIDSTVTDLKQHLEKTTGVPSSMQKVMFKGRMKDNVTLREQKVVKGSRLMLIGSTVNDVMSVSAPDPKVLKQEEKAEAEANKQSLCKMKPHKTVLDKHGKPDDVLPGVKGRKDPLPNVPLSGMYNKSGGKVRLTFKLEQDQLWIGTKERTDKIGMNSIKTVVSEPIDDHEQYHIMGIQLGPTEASRYWIYWVPAQYVDSIKDAILGKWQFF